METTVFTKDKIDSFTLDFLKIEEKVNEIAQKILVHDEIKRNDEYMCIVEFRFANHDRQIIIVNYMPSYSSYYKDLQFPVSFLYNENWEKEYLEQAKRKKQENIEAFNKMLVEEDLKKIAAFKEKYPEQFK